MKIKTKDIYLFVGLVIGSIITMILIAFFTVINLESVEHAVKIISYPFIAGSAVIALLQLKHNTEKNKKEESWNKKYLAFEQISKHIKELEELRLALDKTITKNGFIKNEEGNVISFTDRKRTKEPLSHEEVHKWVCKEYNISDKTDMCSMTEDGVAIVRNLLSIINIYELIAIGIKNDILDKNLVKESLENVIVNNYVFFQPYIKHRREKHEDNTLGEEWELLFKDFTDNK